MHILLRASAPGSAYGGCPKALVFTTKKARFPSPGPPKSTQNRPQTHKNAKLEAKSRRKAISEALETDFEPQDSDLGGQESNVGGQKWRSVIYDEDFWTRSAACARPIAKLESSGYSWSTEKFHTPAILSGCGGFFTLARPAEAVIA